jgi:hypothetical protein
LFAVRRASRRPRWPLACRRSQPWLGCRLEFARGTRQPNLAGVNDLAVTGVHRHRQQQNQRVAPSLPMGASSRAPGIPEPRATRDRPTNPDICEREVVIDPG